jgi:hypothetical protein
MKSRVLLTGLVLIMLVSLTKVLPQTANNMDEELRNKIIQKNPLKGLCCTDPAMRLDCAFALGEKKCANAVIPLMRMLREDPDEAVRIVAALSLIKIGDPIGVYLVKRTAKFNDFSKVRELCQKFYNSYIYHEYLADKENKEAEDILTALPVSN